MLALRRMTILSALVDTVDFIVVLLLYPVSGSLSVRAEDGRLTGGSQ